ncbi:MAG: hypothetical protein FWH22_02535 [Fibromonadales bacterium]|nr:hypothetical protein [Fibromonadales bacterium]
MSPKFTDHGKKQAIKRGVTPEQIDELLADGKTLVIACARDELVSLALGLIDGKLWNVVFNHETGNVVTVRRAKKKERRIYEQQKDN